MARLNKEEEEELIKITVVDKTYFTKRRSNSAANSFTAKKIAGNKSAVVKATDGLRQRLDSIYGKDRPKTNNSHKNIEKETETVKVNKKDRWEN